MVISRSIICWYNSPTRCIVVAIQLRADAKQHQVDRVEADVDAAQIVERAQKQSRADEQHE